MNPYQEQAIATAGPAQLVLMMYDGVLSGVAKAMQAQGEGTLESLEVVNHELQRAQNILTELLITLDRDKGGEIARSMAALYDFAIDRLVRANVTKDLSLLEPVRTVIGDLRDAWEAACCGVVPAAATG